VAEFGFRFLRDFGRSRNCPFFEFAVFVFRDRRFLQFLDFRPIANFCRPFDLDDILKLIVDSKSVPTPLFYSNGSTTARKLSSAPPRVLRLALLLSGSVKGCCWRGRMR
jgi:hypothetical protein